MADLQVRLYDFSKQPLQQSNYAKRISARDWAAIRPVVVKLFERGLPRKDILDQLHSQHDFRPSMSQLVTQAMRWGLTRDRPKGTGEAFVPSLWTKVDDKGPFTSLVPQQPASWEYLHASPSDFSPTTSQLGKQSLEEKASLHEFVFNPVGGGRAWEIAYFNRLAEHDPASWILLCQRTAYMARVLQGKPEGDSCLVARDFIIHSLQIALRTNITVLKYDIALVYGMMYLAADASKRSDVDEARKHVEAACTIFEGTLFYDVKHSKKVFAAVVKTLRGLEPPAMDGIMKIDFESFLKDPMSKVPGLS